MTQVSAYQLIYQLISLFYRFLRGRLGTSRAREPPTGGFRFSLSTLRGLSLSTRRGCLSTLRAHEPPTGGFRFSLSTPRGPLGFRKCINLQLGGFAFLSRLGEAIWVL